MDFSLFLPDDKAEIQKKIKGKSPRTAKDSHIVSPRCCSFAENTPTIGCSDPLPLSPQQIAEVNAFHLQKITEYKKALEECLSLSHNHTIKSAYSESKHEKLKLFNQKADEKRKEILTKKQKEEIERLKKSQSLQINSIKGKIQKSFEKIEKKESLKRKIETQKIEKEKKKKEKKNQEILIENIRNFYKGKISELRDQIVETRICNDLVRFEQKKVLSDLEKKVSLHKSTNKNF